MVIAFISVNMIGINVFFVPNYFWFVFNTSNQFKISNSDWYVLIIVFIWLYVITILQSIIQDPNFQHILRVLNTNINGRDKAPIAITKIKGVGRRFADLILKKAEIDPTKRYVNFRALSFVEIDIGMGCKNQSYYTVSIHIYSFYIIDVIIFWLFYVVLVSWLLKRLRTLLLLSRTLLLSRSLSGFWTDKKIIKLVATSRSLRIKWLPSFVKILSAWKRCVLIEVFAIIGVLKSAGNTPVPLVDEERSKRVIFRISLFSLQKHAFWSSEL